MSTTTPGAVPRGCFTCYPGTPGADPREVPSGQDKSRSFVTARMGVNRTAPDVPAEERDRLTEWVNVMAFSDARRARLLKCKKGEAVAVMGNVTLKTYTTGQGEERTDRTIIAESLRSVSGSRIDTSGEPGGGRCRPQRAAREPGAGPGHPTEGGGETGTPAMALE